MDDRRLDETRDGNQQSEIVVGNVKLQQLSPGLYKGSDRSGILEQSLCVIVGHNTCRCAGIDGRIRTRQTEIHRKRRTLFVDYVYNDDPVSDYVDPAVCAHGEVRMDGYVSLTNRAFDDERAKHHLVPTILHERAASVDRCRTNRRVLGAPDSLPFDLAPLTSGHYHGGDPDVHGELERCPLAADCCA